MGTTAGVPTTYSDSSSPYFVKIRKKLRDIQLRVTTTGYDSDYILQGFIISGNALKLGAPSSWKLNVLLPFIVSSLIAFNTFAFGIMGVFT
jgi:hypothetical protein